jgi:hypothetical protein
MPGAVNTEHYDLVSLGPEAAGWRAVVQGADDPDGSVVPLALWGVFHWTTRKSDGITIVKDNGNIVAGLVGDSIAPKPNAPFGDFLCIAGPGLIGYLSPQMADPSLSA